MHAYILLEESLVCVCVYPFSREGGINPFFGDHRVSILSSHFLVNLNLGLNHILFMHYFLESIFKVKIKFCVDHLNHDLSLKPASV